MQQPDIQDMSRAAFEAWLDAVGEPRWRGVQILGWVHRRAVGRLGDMANVPKALRARLEEAFALRRFEPTLVRTAVDGTQKMLFDIPAEPATGTRAAAIESVLIPQRAKRADARDRLTLCISSQAGCGMGCGFCATAQMGLVRNLRPAEIVGQVRAGLALAAPRPLTNVVLMGMGEPLANYDAVVTAVETLTAEWGYAISPRRITVSTVGLAPDVPRFIADTRVNLAVSLHATTDEQRTRIVPVNRRYPLEALLAACREVPLERRRRITFEYVMLDGENDRDDDAHRLARLLRDLRAKVNLICFNPFPGTAFRPTPRARIVRFQELLLQHGLTTTIRESRGDDIQAACGQLAATRGAA